MTNWIVAAAVVMVALVASRLQRIAVRGNWMSATTSRKLAHIALGWLILFSWLLYDDQTSAKWIAALPSIVLAAYFLLLGVGWIRDEYTVRAGSRSGSAREFALGPTFYVLSLAVITVTFWRSSPIGIAALMFMICGDAAADLVGTRVSAPTLPWNRRKSVAGSAAAMAAGVLGVSTALWVFAKSGHLGGAFVGYLMPTCIVSFAGTAAESLAAGEFDNITVPLACVVVGLLAF
jgi:dolichol kinase